MKKFLIILFIIFLLHLVLADKPLWAQRSLEGMPITSIEAQSRIGISNTDIEGLVGIKPGDTYSSQRIRDSLDLLYKTDLFRDIGVEAKIQEGGVTIRYVLIERIIISKISIRGNLRFRDRKIKEQLGIRRSEELTESRLKKAISRLTSFYHKEGYFQMKSTTDVTPEEAPNRVRITIHIHKGPRARIKQMTFTGNKVFSDLRLWSLVRSQGGELYKGQQLEKDLKALEDFYQSKGYHQASIGPPEVQFLTRTKELTLNFPIDAGKKLELSFQESKAFSENKLLSLLLFREERSYEDHVIDASADRIRSFYHSNGYPFADVLWSREEKLDRNVVLVGFKVVEGPLICFRELSFEGNQFFENNRLERNISHKPLDSAFWCNPFNKKRLDKDIERIRSLYSQEGFHEVQLAWEIPYPEDIKELSRANAITTITITEGVRTLVEEVVITGNNVIATPELKNQLSAQTGKPFNTKMIRRDVDVIRSLYSQKGYIYAEIDVNQHLSADRSGVRLNYKIDEDRLVRVGRIILEGNTFTHDYVIERELKIEPGDPYNEEKIQMSRHKLLRLGFLRDISFRPVTPFTTEDKEYRKDMLLSVRDRPPKVLEFGVGYANVERFRGFAQISHTNIAGTGRRLTLRGEASSIDRKSTLIYLEPWLFSRNINGRVTGVIENQVRKSYDLNSIGFSVGIEKNLNKRLKGFFTYQIEFDNFTDVPEEVLDKEDQGRVNLATLNPSLIFDSRDNPFDPTSGTLSGISFRFGAKNLGSEVQLRKVTIESHWFFPMTRWLVLALSARGGLQDKFGDSPEVPPRELFFIGGRNTVRGYEEQELGIVGKTVVPKEGSEETDSTGIEFTGGKALLNGNVELRFLLPAGLGLVAFMDRGNVWFSNDEDLQLHKIKIDEIKTTVGGGVRYNTPVGPIRIDVGYKLDHEKDLCGGQCLEPVEESRSELHFTLGHAF